MLKSVLGTNHYSEMRVKFLAQGNTGSLWWVLNSRLANYTSDVLAIAPSHPSCVCSQYLGINDIFEHKANVTYHIWAFTVTIKIS